MLSGSLSARCVVGTMVAGGLGVWIGTAASEQGHTTAVPSATSAKQQECRGQLAYFLQFGSMRNGLLTDTGFVLNVEDGGWNRLTDAEKSIRAMTAYCAFAPSVGEFTLTVRGLKGTDMLKIQNGIEQATAAGKPIGFFSGHAGR